MSRPGYRQMIVAMLRTGLIGFGGGTALIPVVEKEVVTGASLLSEEEFNQDVLIASITPGALPVQIASGIGHMLHQNTGMIGAAFCMAFPGAFLTLFLLILLSGLTGAIKRGIDYAAAAVSLFILWVLFTYVRQSICQAGSRRERGLFLLLIFGVFFLCGEKNLYRLFGLEPTPVFGLSTLQILGSVFFIILAARGRLRRFALTLPALALTACYFVSAGKAHLLPSALAPLCLAVMIVWALLSFFRLLSERPEGSGRPGHLPSALASWIGVTLLLSLPALILLPGTLRFIMTGYLSSFMSFGGGDAYLTIAEGLFVNSGMVPESVFYGSIVTIANALPGSILCKILTGIGYTIGYGLHNSLTEGLCLALCGFAVSVSASGCIFQLMWAFYEKYEDLGIFAVIRHYLRPIMSGLLINAGLSLFFSVIFPLFATV